MNGEETSMMTTMTEAPPGHHRFLSPDYADGISASRASLTGRPLPTPRAISAHIHKVDTNKPAAKDQHWLAEGYTQLKRDREL